MTVFPTLRMYSQFMLGLPRFLRRRITLGDAEAVIREGLQQRSSNFLRIVKTGVFEHARSPYLPLLRHAGCEFGDLEKSVQARGLEPTLEALRAEGVYVTFEEFKGRRPIVRGDVVVEIDEHAFDNPLTAKAYEGRTSGSTGRASRVSTDLDNIYAQTPHLIVARHVHGMLGLPVAVWKGTLPDPVGLEVYLRGTLAGNPPERWFTPLSGDQSSVPLRFRLATQYVLVMSRLCGVPCPTPEPLPLDQAVRLARWAAEAVRRRGACEIVASVSLGARVCLAAEEAGLDLTGVSFFGGGEPITAAKRAVFERVGSRHVTIYVSVDTGPIGVPCAAPLEENDQHLLEDSLALIQHPRDVSGGGLMVHPFYFTTLRYQASKVLLNVESDDYGIVETRTCGCALEALGYRRHLRQISSFGKLTGEGVTLVGSDMVRVLEEVLPARFGGTPQDYQLTEDEAEHGQTRLTLLVNPSLQIPREQDLIDVLLDAVGAQSLAGRMAQAYWRQAGTIGVRRQSPVWTASGKLPSLRVGRPR